MKYRMRRARQPLASVESGGGCGNCGAYAEQSAARRLYDLFGARYGGVDGLQRERKIGGGLKSAIRFLLETPRDDALQRRRRCVRQLGRVLLQDGVQALDGGIALERPHARE